MDMHQSEQENGDQDDFFQSERHHDDGVTKDIANERPQHNEENNLEGIIMEINNSFSGYYNAMKSIDEWLGQGVKNYPDSEELCMLVNKRNQEFNLSWPDFSNGNSSHDETFCDAAMTPVTHGHANTTKNIDVQTALDDFVQPTPFTQILITEAYDNLERSTLITIEKRKKSQCDSPSDHFDSNPKTEEVKVSPLPVVAPRQTKRFVNLTDKLRSPNFNRVIDPNKVLTSIEERVSGWIFAGLDNKWDLLFESTFGDRGHRGIFESMIPGSNIHVTIIDIWTTILNHQEQHKIKNSPSRMFLSCTLLCNYVLDETIPIDRRYKMFCRRMNEHLEKYKQHTNFNDVELVFFPILTRDHYYLIVFDIIKAECIILDNIYSEEPIFLIYGSIPYDLDVLFKLYIESSNHPKRKGMKRASPVKFIMQWMTKKNYTDCGIFLMRHMETYKGEGVDKWNVNLEPESEHTDDQQIQLDELRKKYVAKILTSDVNVLKPFVYSKLPTYDNLPDEDKKNFNTKEHLSRIESRISLFF